MTLPPPPEPLTITDLVRYRGASGGTNPLHHDPEHARAAGFDSPISVGMRFREPVLAGDTLTCTSTLADLELTCTRQTGGVAAQGWATFCLERSSS